MADSVETSLTAGGGSIIGAVLAYFGIERRIKVLEDESKKHITEEDCHKCSTNAAEWRKDISGKLDMLIELHLTGGKQ